MTDSLQTVHVALGERSYDIDIGTGLLATLGERLKQRLTPSHAVVITDSNVRVSHADAVVQSLRDAGIRHHLAVIPAGEASKNSESAAGLWNEMLAAGADRKSLVVAVGGGVIGDLAGFIAATFARGLS
ncbi:MAG: iron-containing alcohol dehydrogenase, partial [Planctomycetales bacterium]|nr:iron-containing alcohol dehydrogenase [Planctomycetales bacterium]